MIESGPCFHLVTNALEESNSSALRERADRAYGEASWDDAAGLSSASGRKDPTSDDYLAQVSSFRLRSVYPESDWKMILHSWAEGRVGEILRQCLGDAVVCDLDQSWVRRQYAPKRYPPRHTAHGWHQDGALGFDFLAPDADHSSVEALLPMVTCWLALTDCGRHAPGLELVAHPIDHLVHFRDLTDAAVRLKFPKQAFHRPAMKAGDALVFAGHILHRTHVNDAMVSDRTSLEFRFVSSPNVPARLAGDCFVPMGA